MRTLRHIALVAAITLGLGNSSCRVKSSTHTDDDDENDGRTQTLVVLPGPIPGVAPIVLPSIALR